MMWEDSRVDEELCRLRIGEIDIGWQVDRVNLGDKNNCFALHAIIQKQRKNIGKKSGYAMGCMSIGSGIKVNWWWAVVDLLLSGMIGCLDSKNGGDLGNRI